MAFENSESLEEMKFNVFKPTFMSSMSCKQIDAEVNFNTPVKRSRVDSLISSIKKNILKEEFTLATHKFTIDHEKQLLYHLCSTWNKLKVEGSEEFEFELQD